MLSSDEAALQIWQSHRDTDRAVVAALLDDYFAPAEYTATLDAVRTAISEPGECVMGIDDIEDVGRLTSGIKDNARDIVDLWMMRPLRRVEFGEREIQDLREAVLGLWTILREIEAREAA